MAYREFNGEDYTALRKKLLKEKGSAFQKEFLDVLKDNDQFIHFIEEQVKIEKDGEDFELLSDKRSESEFKRPPAAAEKELFQKWGAITPAQACRATFWGYMTLRHIKEGKINAHFLAANGGTLPGGLERIDAALSSGDEKSIDSIVRAALRRLSGLPEARGNRTVYVDCPFARTWWRGHIAQQVCETTDADLEKVIDILRFSQGYWEKLIESVVSKNSVFGDIKIRAALIWALSERDDKGNVDTLNSTIKQIGIRLAWQELAIFEPVDLKIIFEKEFLNAI